MGLSRRFLNLIVESYNASTRTLRCIDLKGVQLFYPASPPATRPPAMETFALPSPNFYFQACSLDAVHQPRVACFTLARRKVLCSDHRGRNFLYDASTREVSTMPEFHIPRLNSAALFVPSDQGGEHHHHHDGDDCEEGREDEEPCGAEGEGHLFLMEKILRPRHIGRPAAGSDVEVLFYGNGNGGSNMSHSKPLPPPPSSDWDAPSTIGSYAVVGNGSHVCISVDRRGTYFLDTARHTWDKVGDWTLPFNGKAEYVPELKLWFGLSADAQHLVAADLFTTDRQPQQLVNPSKEFQPPEEWFELSDAQLVNLGSGRFCIARFFGYEEFGNDYNLDIVVLTGLEVLPVPNGNGELKLKMIPHKSMCHTSSPDCRTPISLVF